MGASLSDVDFRANPGERPIQSQAPLSLAGTSRWLALFGALLIHAAVLSLLILENERRTEITPVSREIPIEIVVEPPPPPKKPDDPPKPEPTQQQVYEEPAYDAPRAANKEKVERETPDDASKAAGPEPATSEPTPPPAAAQAPEPKPEGERPAAEKSSEAEADKAVAGLNSAPQPEGEAPQEREARVDAKAQPEKLATLVGQPFPSWSRGQHFSTFEPLPDIELGGAAGPSPISGGKAKSTYLTILYGMIMSHLRLPAAARSSAARLQGDIIFTVDGAGNLTQRQVERSSGSLDFDSAALEAVGEAAPFPTPPMGLPMRLTFTFGAK